jgi:hypothetical protein
MIYAFCQVHHFIHHSMSAETMQVYVTPKWEILVGAARDYVDRKEFWDPAITQRVWSCNHCPAHLNKLVTRDEVIAHIQNMCDPFTMQTKLRYSPINSRCITEPKEGSDFFSDPRAIIPKGLYFKWYPIELQPLAGDQEQCPALYAKLYADEREFHCIVCPGPNRWTLSLMSVRAHMSQMQVPSKMFHVSSSLTVFLRHNVFEAQYGSHYEAVVPIV